MFFKARHAIFLPPIVTGFFKWAPNVILITRLVSLLATSVQTWESGLPKGSKGREGTNLWFLSCSLSSIAFYSQPHPTPPPPPAAPTLHLTSEKCDTQDTLARKIWKPTSLLWVRSRFSCDLLICLTSYKQWVFGLSFNFSGHYSLFLEANGLAAGLTFQLFISCGTLLLFVLLGVALN